MMSWRQAGVSLPHQASAQYNVGQHVSYSQLQPGDLIFLYHPISHVEIYVGPDLAVSAGRPGDRHRVRPPVAGHGRLRRGDPP